MRPPSRIMQLFKFIILLIAALLTLSQCSAESCMNLFNVTRNDLEAITADIPINQVSNQVKCYSKCVIKDYFNDQGKIDLELVGKRAKEPELNILAECKIKYDHNFAGIGEDDDVRPNENCEYAYLMLQCLYLGSTNGTATN